MPASTSTVRFATVVAKAGKPTPYLAWSAPAKDPHFKSALAQHKVMTIRQHLRGSHKDAGEVGYVPERNIQLLLFPRSLRRFEDKRIVGIDYALIGNEPASGGKVPAPKRVKAVERPSKTIQHREEEPAARPIPNEPRPKPPAKRGTKIVAFPQAEETGEAGEKRARRARSSSERPMRSRAGLHPAVARQIHAALRELKAGKAVAAYERLSSLVR